MIKRIIKDHIILKELCGKIKKTGMLKKMVNIYNFDTSYALSNERMS